MIVLHHLQISQSERITWLLEELEIPYKLVTHVRAPVLAPDSLKNVPGNSLGRSPFIEDTDNGVSLAESGAITDYIIWKHAGGKLALKPDDKNFANYLYWKDYANATMQATMLTSMFVQMAEPKPDNMAGQFCEQRLVSSLKHLDDWLKDNKWLAGEEFTAADTMNVYALTTQRYFGPQASLKDYPNLLRWLGDCTSRPAYKRAMEKADPEMKPLIGGDAPSQSLLAAGGSESDIWKK